LESITISSSEVEDVINCLKIGKASGPDGVDNRLLKEYVEHLKLPLCELLNSSLQNCYVLSSWKIDNVCAVYKKEIVHLCQITGLYPCYQQ
jgi:hypothetical protein